MCVLICNHFYARRVNSGKMRTIMGVPLFDALVREEPPQLGSSTRGSKFHDKKVESLAQPTVKIS